jgi:CRP-like cAMP-binding protein
MTHPAGLIGSFGRCTSSFAQRGKKVMADFLDDTRLQIAARLRELKPLADEYQRLQAAAAALDGLSRPLIAASPAPRRRSAQTRAAPAQRRDRDDAKRRGRPKGSGTRGREALELVKAHPGITIPQIADKMGIKQNYLYRLLPSLADDGLVSKQGRGWHPAAGGSGAVDDAAVAQPPGDNVSAVSSE